MTEKADSRQRQIVDAARGLFFSRGYDAVSIQEIIDAVGIAKGTFYHHFASKEELLERLVDDVSDEIIQRLQPIVTDESRTPTERISDYFRNSLIIKSGSPDMMRLAFEALYRDENALLLLRLKDLTAERVAPRRSSRR